MKFHKILQLIKNPNDFKNIKDDELIKIIKKINFNILGKLNNKKHAELLRKNNKELFKGIIEKAEDYENLDLILDTIKLECLIGKELYKLIKVIIKSTGNNKEGLIKFFIKVLKTVDHKEIEKMLIEVKENSSSKVVNELINVFDIVRESLGICVDFSENLNTIIEEIRDNNN